MLRLPSKTMFAAAVACSILAGCSNDEPPLPYDSTLTGFFRENLLERTVNLDVNKISLECKTQTGPLEIIFEKSTGKEYKKTFTSKTPCTEKGTLTYGVYEPGYMFAWYAKHVYETNLVMNEVKDALDNAYGTLAYNKELTQEIKEKIHRNLADSGISSIKFTCVTTDKTIQYTAYYRGSEKKGSLKTACPSTQDKSEILLSLENRPDGYGRSNTLQDGFYWTLSTSNISTGTGIKILQDFLQADGPRKSF